MEGETPMPTLHLVSPDEVLVESLLPVLEHSGFRFSHSADLYDASAVPMDVDLVLFAPTRFNESDYAQLAENPLSTDAEWMIITDGKPNPLIDALMAHGASYHFRKPLDIKHIADVLADCFNELKEEKAARAKKAVTSNLDQFGLLLGSSSAMRLLYRLIRRVSQTDANVLLIGESGSGKELAARTIHQQSQRAHKPFVAVNSAALTPELVESELFGHTKGAFTGAVKDHAGFFEQGNGGTLFLDEITEMPLSLQSKLLRVLESGEFTRVGSDTLQKTDVRVIAATNRNPMEAIDQGFMREDLYFRLAHFPVNLPPLRKRASDIVELAKHFLAYRNAATDTNKQFSQEALDAISHYHWPGNVRELKHTIERAHILAVEEISTQELPSLFEHLNDDADVSLDDIKPGTTLKDAEKALIMATLDDCEHNKTQAADQLGISIKTLYNKLERYDEDNTEKSA
jgi:DNA-binding NtrC family response regulator